jgi:hypothetical protein
MSHLSTPTVFRASLSAQNDIFTALTLSHEQNYAHDDSHTDAGIDHHP